MHNTPWKRSIRDVSDAWAQPMPGKLFVMVADPVRRVWKAIQKLLKQAVVWAQVGGLGLRGSFGKEGTQKNVLLRLGKLIRFRSRARDSKVTYRVVDRLLNRCGLGFAEGRLDGQSPESFVLFIGHPRSGHSLVGSLLDAHPEAIISHELHALKFLHNGASYEEIVRYIKYNSFFFEYFGRSYTGYDYRVPGYYQGTYANLKVAGDKKANRTTRYLRRHPRLLEILIKEWPVPVRFVHVIRNPLDNIATNTLRTRKGLDESTRIYFANAAYIHRLKQWHPERVIDLYLDDLIAKPEETLANLLGKLALPADPEYLRACGEVVADKPSETRFRVHWDPSLRDRIYQGMEDYPFLARYRESPL